MSLELGKRSRWKSISKSTQNVQKPVYRDYYSKVSLNARRQAYKKSFISMFRNYLAIALSDKKLIEDSFSKFSNQEFLSGDNISDFLSFKLNQKRKKASEEISKSSLSFEPGKIPEDTKIKSLEEITNLINEAYNLRTPNAVRLAARSIRDNFFNENFKSDEKWIYFTNTLINLSNINPESVREGLKYTFKKSTNTLKDYKLKLILELGPEGKKIIEDLELFANELKSRGKNKIGIVNATFHGGGPAEMFATIGPLVAELGIEIEWHIVYPKCPEFYNVSKGIHNTLQGNDVLWNSNLSEDEAEKELDSNLNILDETNQINSIILSAFFKDNKSAAIFIEDPQVIPLVEYGSNIKAWRLHTDISGLTKKNPGAIRIWNKFQDYLKNLNEDCMIMFQPGLVAPTENLKAKIIEQYPGIDPLSEKNRKMEEEEFLDHIKEVNMNKKQLFGNPLDIDTPTIVAGSRFDYWKGLPIVLRSFEKNANINKSINLVIFGSYADDDPEGKAHFNLLREMINKSPHKERIHLITGYSGRKIGSLYKLASRHQMPFIAYSLKEGYNLMTNENEIQGGASIVARTGGLKRYETGLNSLGALDIEDITSKIKDASELYKSEEGRIIISEEAIQLEERLSKALNELIENYNKLKLSVKKVEINFKKEIPEEIAPEITSKKLSF